MSPPITPKAGNSRPPLSPHAPEEMAVERRGLRDYYIIIRERAWIALPIAVLVALAYGFYHARETPMYESRATMQFKRPERVVTSEQVVDASVRNDVDLNTYLKILESGRLRQMVAQSLTPDEIKLLQRPYSGGNSPVPGTDGLLGSLSIGSIRNSFIIDIRVTNRDPDGAALIANRYSQQFLRYLIEDVGGQNEGAVAYLKERAEELRRESEASAARLQDFKRKNNLADLDSNVNIISERLRTVNAALTAERLQRLNLEIQLRQIEKLVAEGGKLLEVSFIANHGNIPALSTQLSDLTRQQTVLAERYLEKHPKMIELANSIAALRSQLERAVSEAVADLRSQLAKARESENSYEREYTAAEKEQLRLNELKPEFDSLANQAAVKKNSYSQILDRLNQTTTSKDLANIPVKPLDPAVRPWQPFSPNLRRILQTSVGLGIAAFLGVALGLSLLDDRVKSAWDVETFIGAQLLGIIPDLGDIPKGERHQLGASEGTTHPSAEAFLGIYSAVKINSRLDFPKILVVTSTVPSEGKSTVSCNLASCFARHGKRVLLVDGDLRRPMLHRNFGLENESGLLAWYDEGAGFPAEPLSDPKLGIIRVADEFYLLRSGGRSRNPTHLLESERFASFLASLRRHFDLVVIDSPPMGAVTDALLIAGRVDEAIYVCRFNRAFRKHIRLHVKQLRNTKTELLGIVLNGLTPRRIEYYSNYRYYRSYKKYYGAQS